MPANVQLAQHNNDIDEDIVEIDSDQLRKYCWSLKVIISQIKYQLIQFIDYILLLLKASINALFEITNIELQSHKGEPIESQYRSECMYQKNVTSVLTGDIFPRETLQYKMHGLSTKHGTTLSCTVTVAFLLAQHIMVHLLFYIYN